MTKEARISNVKIRSAGRALLHLAVGGSVGLVLGAALIPLMPEHARIAETVSIFAIVGVWGGLLRLLFKTYDQPGGRSRRIIIPREPSDVPCDAPDETTQPPEIPPAPFDSRLAHFLGCDESELQPERTGDTSKMRFWSLVPLGQWHGPKPRWRIRYLLERIRTLVRGGTNRR